MLLVGRRRGIAKSGAAAATPLHSGDRAGAQVASPHCPILHSGILRVDHKNPLAQPPRVPPPIWVSHFWGAVQARPKDQAPAPPARPRDQEPAPPARPPAPPVRPRDQAPAPQARPQRLAAGASRRKPKQRNMAAPQVRPHARSPAHQTRLPNQRLRHPPENPAIPSLPHSDSKTEANSAMRRARQGASQRIAPRRSEQRERSPGSTTART
jgi:hypothetical protein